MIDDAPALPLHSQRSAFEQPAAAAAAARNANASVAAAPLQTETTAPSASASRDLLSSVLGDPDVALLESAVSEEVSALEGCKIADQRALETCAKRLQQLAARWKQQQQQSSGGSLDVTAAPQLKRDSARVWKWLSDNKHKMAKAKDLQAASKGTHERKREGQLET